MSVNKDLLETSIIIDTGVLIELLENSELGNIFSKHFLENPQFERYYISPITDTELKYIFCRRSGYQEAKRIVSDLLKDFIICSESKLRDDAFRLKCNFPISLADSYSLAVAIVLNIPLCMKKEKEILKNLEKLSSEVKIMFIDDYS
ncbi:MAG: PIN domain-containing protein [Candidatus Lokiarchaeota archaeon]|nr:PIN domain-containing protein [Candidatus Lokiarchaeota archaeon]